VVDRQQNRATFDAIELARWNVDEDRLPADSRIVYRQPSVWDDYRTEIMAAGLVIGLQGLLIVALLLNRARLHRTRAVLRNEYERRRQAEDVAFSLQRRLVKFSRQRTLGAMATGIAHEINQPLIAIQNYAQALRQRLRSHVDQRPKLLELLEKIEYQAARAGDTIQSLRNLVTTNSAKLRPVSLYFVLGQVIQMVEPDIKSRGTA
jgi:C4-dicarboxylate-specific signal transduction histidine kinase